MLGGHGSSLGSRTSTQSVKIIEKKGLLLNAAIIKWLDLRVCSDKDVKIVGTLDPPSIHNLPPPLGSHWHIHNV